MKTSPPIVEPLGEALRDVLGSFDLAAGADISASTITTRARDLLEADVAAFVVASEGAPGWVVAGTEGLSPQDLARGFGSSVIPIVLQAGRSLRIDERAPDSDRERLAQVGMGSAVLVPLMVDARVLGALCLARARPREPFDDDEVAFAEVFARHIAMAVECANRWRERSAAAVVEDRERFARDLHDGVIQSLISVTMGLARLAASPEARGVADRINGLIENLKDANRELRSYVLLLRAPGPEASLGESLGALVSDFEWKSGIRVSVEVDEQLSRSPVMAVVDLLQVVREALSNVARHADAAACRISLCRCGELVVLSVEDDGKGFDIEKSRTTGEGLRNLESRAAALNGRLEVDTGHGEGTTVRVFCPPWRQVVGG